MANVDTRSEEGVITWCGPWCQIEEKEVSKKSQILDVISILDLMLYPTLVLTYIYTTSNKVIHNYR